MAKLNPKTIIGIVIGLMLMGILLPIGINEMTSYDADNPTKTYTFTSQSPTYQYNYTLTSGQKLNYTLTYTHATYRLNATIYEGTTAKNSQNTANQTLEYEYTATTNGAHSILVESIGVGFPTFNITIRVITVIDSSFASNMETLIGQVIPIVAIVGFIMAMVPTARRKGYL